MEDKSEFSRNLQNKNLPSTESVLKSKKKNSKNKKEENLKKELKKKKRTQEMLQGKIKLKKVNSTTDVDDEYNNDSLIENLLDSDYVPSDSSEDESGHNDVNIKEQKEKTKNIYTDFTNNTIFVGNLPINYDKKKVIKLFSNFGKIVCARIRCVPIANINMKKKVAAIKREFNPQRNSLVAYVKYKSKVSVNAAVEANGMIVDGHHLRIDLAKNDKERDINKAIFVGGLPFNIEDDELWEFFENCGKIQSVRVIRDSHTSMGKGIGYVNFDSAAAVELALQMNGQELKKRVINVQRCMNPKKKNRLKSFGKKKSEEMVSHLLSKRNQVKKKVKSKKQTAKPKTNALTNDFHGNIATLKKKKRKKPSKDLLHKKKMIKLLKDS